MKNRRLLFLSLLLYAVGVFAQEPTHMSIVPLNGAEEQLAITQIGKITFSEDVMYLWAKNGDLLGSTPVSLIDKIVFTGELFHSIDNVNDCRIQVFPNPTSESLIVRGLEDEQVVRVYSMDGQLMQSAVTINGESKLQVNGLQSGTYLLQAGANVVKFIKK